ncbi:unnamed protein product [Pedinophyceae sp. YPF-701]|nr:unnamed protein product [Pedinophyceae sp. YPF-701]
MAPSDAPLDADALGDVMVTNAGSGEVADLRSLVGTGRCLVAFLTHLGDFDSWEYAQALRPRLAAMEADSKVKVVVVAIGSPESGRLFCELTGLPDDVLWMDPDATSYKRMSFEPGLKLGGEQPVNPYVRLMAMCAGLGSPGTLPEVFRGYLGDRGVGQVWKGDSYDPRPLPFPAGAFDVVGRGYQRPFELATLRLLNMADILARWDKLKPAEDELILQRGGTVVLDGGRRVWMHKDRGILGYANVDTALQKAMV